MESEIDCTVCVATKNPRFVNRFLQALFDHADPVSLQVIVINMGEDKSLDFIVGTFPDVIIFESNVEESPAKAWNRVLQLGRGRYVAVCHDEIVLEEGSLQSLIDFLDDNPDAGLVGSQLVSWDHRLLLSAAPFPTFFSFLVSGGGLPGTEIAVTSSDLPLEVDWLPGVCLVLNGLVLDDIGFFDENFFCCESLDYCWRARRAGWHIHLFPGSEVVFRQPVFASFRVALANRLRDGFRFFYKKWLSLVFLSNN